MPSAQSEKTVQEVYIAFYGRPADPAGLEYWGNRLDNEGGDLTAIIDSFANGQEAQDLYGGLDAGSTIDLIYNQMFGRAPDIAGKNFYVGQLNDPDSGVTLQSITVNVLQGAQNEDAQIIANKLTVAQNFTNSLDAVDATDGANEVSAYGGSAAITEGRALLNNVDETPASLTTALNEIDNTIDRLVGRDNPSEGDQIFTLQASNADNFTGGSGDDLFRGPDANALESIDVIDGGDGYDTLEAQAAILAAPIINNVEKIENITNFNGFLNMEFVSGEQEVWSSNNPATEHTQGLHTYTNADILGVKYIATENTSMAINFNSDHDLSGSSDTLMLGIDDSTSLFTSFDAGNIEKIELEVGSGSANVATVSNFTALENIMISGTGNLEIIADNSALTEINASSLDGGLTAQIAGSSLNGTIQGGSGDDTLSFESGDDTLHGNAGNDNLTGNVGDDDLFGGTGNDGLYGGDGEDFLEGGADEDTLNGNADNDVLAGGAGNDDLSGGTGMDEFRFNAGEGSDILSDFSSAEGDIIAFAQNGAISFANSTDSSDAANDLHVDDFTTATSFFATTGTPGDYDQKVVQLTSAFSTDDIANNLGGSAAFYLVVENSDEGHAQIWFDDDWSDATGRELLVDIEGVAGTSLDATDFGVF